MKIKFFLLFSALYVNQLSSLDFSLMFKQCMKKALCCKKTKAKVDDNVPDSTESDEIVQYAKVITDHYEGLKGTVIKIILPFDDEECISRRDGDGNQNVDERNAYRRIENRPKSGKIYKASYGPEKPSSDCRELFFHESWIQPITKDQYDKEYQAKITDQDPDFEMLELDAKTDSEKEKKE